MTSLKQKHLILNSISAIAALSAIALLSYVGNQGFKDLVDISARNLSDLYTTGDLKSNLWEELSNSEAFLEGRVSLVEFNRSAEEVARLAKLLEERSAGEPKVMLSRFIAIHHEIAEAVRKPGATVAQIARLYEKERDQLTEFSDSVLLRSQEQQSETIHHTNAITRWTVLAAIGTTLVILFFIFFYLERSVIRPILRISNASLAAARGEHRPIPTLDSDSEIRVLAENFNHMMVKIQSSADAIRAERDIAEKANLAKSAFLANMSHELRTPMHGILSFARFGQQKIDTATKERLKGYFDEIYDSGSRLMSLLNDILDLSKLEAGKIAYSAEQTELTEAVRLVVSELDAFAQEKRLQVEVVSSSSTQGIFDSTRIMQVVRNVLSNAIKFSDADSTIRIDLEKSDRLLRCRIANQGVGIPESELEAIFDKFIQSSKTRTGAGGTGLGLAICKEIIQQHGGRIWAECGANGETRFTFEIPEAATSAVREAA